MNVDVIRRMRKAREIAVDIGDFRFLVLRPTEWQVQNIVKDGATVFDVARDSVIGWERVKECDLVKGGASDEIAFDKMLWAEWVEDRVDFWGPINKAVMDSYSAFKKRAEENAKN